MWRLFNRLFGWHYALVVAVGMDYRYVLRVRHDAGGELYATFYGEVWYLLPDGKVDFSGYRWRPLTWVITK